MSGQSTSSLGCRISLTSNSEIRYEGFLAAINEHENTVSLMNVRMFGTEGRRNSTNDDVAPGEALYEFIVFSGADIKDLTVYEEAPLPKDPAILSGKAVNASTAVAAQSISASVQNPTNTSQRPHAQSGASTRNNLPPPSRNMQPSGANAPYNNAYQNQQQNYGARGGNRGQHRRGGESSGFSQQDNHQNMGDAYAYRGGGRGGGRRGGYDNGAHHRQGRDNGGMYGGNGHMYHQDYRNQNQSGMGGGRRGGGMGPMSNGGGHHRRRYPPMGSNMHGGVLPRRRAHTGQDFEVAKDTEAARAEFVSDYDFETNNEQVEKEKHHPVVDPSIKANTEIKTKKYDKARSFFDNISSETIDKKNNLPMGEARGRIIKEDRQNAQRLDLETFGTELVELQQRRGGHGGQRSGGYRRR